MTSLLAILLFSIAIFAAPAKESRIIAPAEAEKKAAAETRTISNILYSLGNLYSYIDTCYLYDIDQDSMEEDLISAMVGSLGDQYSMYIPNDETESYVEGTNGKYVGIGVLLSKYNPSMIDPEDPRTYMAIIETVYKGGPAEKAGIRPNDMISAINGESVYHNTSYEVSRKLRGEKGVSVTLTVLRGDSSFEITLAPDEVRVPSTSEAMLDDGIGYIYISSFSLTTSDDFREKAEKLLSEGMEKLIIDLRNNGGGTVDSAYSIADYLMSDGIITSIRFKEGSSFPDQVIKVSENTIIPESMPVVLLVNEGTASSSEILTAALKENSRAIAVGSRTFGKGIIQSSIPFRNGIVQLTIGHYYTPDGNDIHKKGIEPDIVIESREYSSEDMKAYEEFMKTDALREFRLSHPEFTQENLEAFREMHKSSGVPGDLLIILMRNEYIYEMDADERPIADPVNDEVLRKAMEILR